MLFLARRVVVEDDDRERQLVAYGCLEVGDALPAGEREIGG
ncbi:hypothetical protein OIE62_00320 [Streptomyces scopuliridis]|uniref:Uncharacterized protein n=1 Tax=Streptomyces scopuliridis TaxID=452529 RepID=A0ACD4ZWG2_9ACTN|nr:hypothetical protein [Streptomyces scopuliridis]WSC02820.1 hypothetical protein OG835_41510 [Streptomyces scopuliridis]WSC03646.1 hypothetical protein OIE62_00320 [Streptomyces scopuliridis]